MFLIIGASRSSDLKADAVPTEIASWPRLLYRPPRICPWRYRAESFSSTRRFRWRSRCISSRRFRGSPGFLSAGGGPGGGRSPSPAARSAGPSPRFPPLDPGRPATFGKPRASEMDAAGVQVEGRLPHRLGKCGMGVDRLEQVLHGRLQAERHAALGEELRRLRPDDV